MKKIKALLKNRVGMTFVELLTALALLVIIITSFTPMLLNSYKTLYDAGELNEKTYISKTKVETFLASRDSESIENFQLNALSKQLFIKMRAALGEMQADPFIQRGIETFYYGGKGYIKIVSPSVIPDNEPMKEVVIQFKGINVTEVKTGGESVAELIPAEKSKSGKDEYIIGIEVVLPNTKDGGVVQNVEDKDGDGKPDQGTVTEKDLFNASKTALTSDQYTVSYTTDKNGKKQATIRIFESVDVVTTVVKINAYYIDENGNDNVATAYFKVTPAHIMLVGETSKTDQSVDIKDSTGATIKNVTIPNVSYYTSAGVVSVREKDEDATKAKTGTTTQETEKLQFEVYPRTLSTKNTPSLVEHSDNEDLPYPEGTVFKTIKWIDNDDSAYLNSYYVMAGNNGVIQRLFISNGSSSDASKIVGKDLTSAPYTDNGLQKILYPTFWGGDRSHQFGYASSRNRPGYREGSWYTDSNGLGKTHYDVYSAQTRFSYYYNGLGIADPYMTKNGRRISYVLTEYAYALRLIGGLEEKDHFRDDYHDEFKSYYMAWEHPHTRTSHDSAFRDDPWHTNKAHRDWIFFHQPVGYYGNKSKNSNDDNYAYVRIKQLNSHGYKSRDGKKDYMFSISYPGNWDNTYDTVHHICFAGCGCGYTGDATLEDESRQDVVNDINITDFYYDQATKEMTYIGTVDATAGLVQTDNLSGRKAYMHTYNSAYDLKGPGVDGDDNDINDGDDANGGLTGYFIEKNTEGSGIKIYKISTDRDDDLTYENSVMSMYQEFKGFTPTDKWSGFETSWKGSTAVKITDPVRFFAERTFTDVGYDNWRKSTTFNPFRVLELADVNFTMGYSSNREKMYSNITWDGANEQYRSYEPYYFWSHYGNQHMYPGTKDSWNMDTYNLNSYTVANVQKCSGNSARKWQITYWESDQDVGFDNTHKAWVNSINNDYYNVWFPGEMYNLTKTATLDGVTVAVGYAVSGSTFQWNHLKDDATNVGNTSTALGSIYNDGVLAATTGNVSETTPMTNLLYYKDATEFDYSSLTTNYNDRFKYLAQQTTQTKSEGLGADGYNCYGTHSRLSVQFTAVDLVTKLVSSSTGENGNTATKEYYAVYGDNHGRIFYSKVAKTTANYSFDTEGNQVATPDGSSTELVRGIRDLSPANERETEPQADWGQMTELKQAYTDKTNEKSFSEYFSYINNIYILDTELYIVGKAANSNNVIVFVGKMQIDAKGEIVDFPRAKSDWRLLNLTSGQGNCIVHDMMLHNGYIYAVGENTTDGKGFCVAVNKLYMNALFSSDPTEVANAEKDYPKFYKSLPYKVYSIAGNTQ